MQPQPMVQQQPMAQQQPIKKEVELVQQQQEQLSSLYEKEMTEEERKKAEKAARKAKLKKRIAMALACKRRITRLRIYYVGMALLNITSLIGYFAFLITLSKAVPFEEDPEITPATSQPNANIPASNEMFEKIAAASTKEILQNTNYIYTYDAGKSQVRVCTDLTREKFEETTGLSEKDFFRL